MGRKAEEEESKSTERTTSFPVKRTGVGYSNEIIYLLK